MKPTRGKLFKWSDQPQMLVVNGLQRVANVYSSALSVEEQQANADLIVASWNAAKEINPENPIAAAEAMPEIFRLIVAALNDSMKVTGKRLDPQQWLREANNAVFKALAKE